ILAPLASWRAWRNSKTGTAALRRGSRNAPPCLRVSILPHNLLHDSLPAQGLIQLLVIRDRQHPAPDIHRRELPLAGVVAGHEFQRAGVLVDVAEVVGHPDLIEVAERVLRIVAPFGAVNGDLAHRSCSLAEKETSPARTTMSVG